MQVSLCRTFWTMLFLALFVSVIQATAGDEQRQKILKTINGFTPPGTLSPLHGIVTMLDTIEADGWRIVVTKGIRKAGTRVGIHIHEYGGHTCVLSGAITDFVEGKAPTLFKAGSCYYMPPNIPMTAANLGSEDAILIDTFRVPPGKPTITILEPGYPGGPESTGIKNAQ